MHLGHGMEDNIKVDTKKINSGVDWIHLAYARYQCQTFLNMIINFQF
jgi:hypothetical protein